MKPRHIAAIVLLISAAAIAAAVIAFHRPYLRGVTIISSEGHDEVTKYAQEFADSLSISTHWNTGEPLSEPHFYLRGEDAVSPNGRFTLHQRPLGNYHHEITISGGEYAAPERVLILQEGDPGSGTSHEWQWSHDSQAVFIYGEGTPAGHGDSSELSLIYVVAQRRLYSIDLKPYLSRRLNSANN